MDTDRELDLYDHVEFLSTVPSVNREQNDGIAQITHKTVPGNNTKKKKKPKQSKAKKKQLPNVTFKLSSTELLFFPKNHNPKPTYTAVENVEKKKKYLERIARKTAPLQRELRNQHDIRRTYRKTKKQKLNEEVEKQFCYDHLVGRCSSESHCGRWHQMRHPRYYGVCKFYLSGACANGDLCQFMHEDYPCRFYYLDMDHPGGINDSNCRFKHGGPLPQRLSRYFKKQIEIWAKDLTKEKPQDFENVLTSFMDKFDAKQAILERECGQKIVSPIKQSNVKGFCIENILNRKQINALAAKDITTFAQINQMPVDDLLDFGLTMDQIYKITTNTIEEHGPKPEHSQVNNQQPLISSYAQMIDHRTTACIDINTLQGFSARDLNEAEQLLHTNRQDDSTSNEMPNNIQIEEQRTSMEIKDNFIADENDSDGDTSLVINEE